MVYEGLEEATSFCCLPSQVNKTIPLPATATKRLQTLHFPSLRLSESSQKAHKAPYLLQTLPKCFSVQFSESVKTFISFTVCSVRLVDKKN